MSDTLTPTEQQAVSETLAKIQALRSDSRRRLAEEEQKPRVMKRRRSNLLHARRAKASAS